MSLEILDGEIFLDGRLVARVADGLPRGLASELVYVINYSGEDEDTERLLCERMEERQDVLAAIARGDEDVLAELDEARDAYRERQC
jgi:hypothetical protein